MLLSSEAAIEHYRKLRQDMGAGNSTHERQARMQDVLLLFSQSLLAPFRIVLSAGTPKPIFYLVLNQGAQGNDEEIWEMHGYHREIDMIRLAVRFRNIYYSGQVSYRNNQDLDSGLNQVMANVERVMAQFVDTED